MAAGNPPHTLKIQNGNLLSAYDAGDATCSDIFIILLHVYLQFSGKSQKVGEAFSKVKKEFVIILKLIYGINSICLKFYSCRIRYRLIDQSKQKKHTFLYSDWSTKCHFINQNRITGLRKRKFNIFRLLIGMRLLRKREHNARQQSDRVHT